MVGEHRAPIILVATRARTRRVRAMYSPSRTLLTIVAVALCGGWYSAEAACNVCQGNGAACVNLTSYHLCFGSSKPFTDQLFTCTDGLECTDLPHICFQSSTRPASCGDTSSCGRCNANQGFACTSRTTFAFCFGATTPSRTSGVCPEGWICDASTTDICVQQVHPNSIVCDLERPART